MPRLTVFSLALLAASCGTDTEANLSAEIGWRFDYADYTSGAAAEIRGCDNGDDRDITAVRVVAVDPDGQIQGFDTTYDCDDGIDARVPIRGVPAGLFELTVEALAGSTVLYRYRDPSFDFSTQSAQTLTLRAAVGELRFRPLVAGSFDCDPNVTQIEVQLFPFVDGTPEATPAVTFQTDAPCNGSFYRQIEITEIPAEPDEGSNGFVLQRYSVDARASSSTGLLACAVFDRAIPPGGASAVGGDETLTAGQCP